MSIQPLYKHIPHPHKPRNVNVLQAQEQLSLNDRIALIITKSLGTMWTAYLFVILAVIGFPGFNASPKDYVQWLSQTFIQLVALSVLAVGQNIIGRKAELQANEQYSFTEKSYHDIEQIMTHQDAQDVEIVSIHTDVQQQNALIKEQNALLLKVHVETQDIKTRVSRMRGFL